MVSALSGAWGVFVLEPIAAAVVPVFAIAALGFLWTRFGGKLDPLTVTQLVADIGMPCLVVATLSHTAIAPDAFAALALATLTAIAGFAAIGALALRLCRLRLRTFLPSIAFPNAGNLGRPLALYAFGPQGAPDSPRFLP
jgi:predicted permease